MRRFVPLFSLAALLAASSASPAWAATCIFTMSMTSGADINNLDYKVNYAGVDNGNIEGTASRPECVRAIGGQTFAGFHDDDANHQLLVSFIRLASFSAPTPLAACKIFYDTSEPTTLDFGVTVTNAGRGGEDNNVAPLPNVVISKVECPGEFPEVTTTTSTTLPGDTTTTTLVSGGDRCGFPVTDGSKPAASDALYTLKAAVGQASCELCVCDVNDSGNVSAGDALTVLAVAVGSGPELDCPPCN